MSGIRCADCNEPMGSSSKWELKPQGWVCPVCRKSKQVKLWMLEKQPKLGGIV